MNRRTALTSLGTLTGSTLLGQSVARRRVLRMAHLTDVHLPDQPQPQAAFARCLHQLQQMPDPPTLILNGGDTIMDALGQEKTKVQRQWDAWNAVVKAECSLPIEYCIGNHDVWGYTGAKNDPKYGKVWAQEQMGIDQPYRLFDRNGWRFIILDSTQPTPEGAWYTANLDGPQRQWLEQTLAATPARTPVLILSHIPIITATAFYDGQTVQNGRWEIPGSWVHTDAADLVKVFHRHPNVKICLSGHMHLLDRVEYNGVTYLCNGAVSGNWWAGPTYHQTHAGYAILDLFDDGSFERQYVLFS